MERRIAKPASRRASPEATGTTTSSELTAQASRPRRALRASRGVGAPRGARLAVVSSALVASTLLLALVPLGSPAGALTSGSLSKIAAQLGAAGTGGSSSQGTTAGSHTCSPTTLAADQAKVQVQLTDRVDQLDKLSGALSGSTWLTASDRTTLTTDLSNELSGIRSLQSTVAGATTCKEVLADARAMVVNYRVFVVMSPQVRLTITADSESGIAGLMARLEGPIQAAIAAAQTAGKNVTGAQAAFTDYKARIAAVQSSTSSMVATILAFTPASYPSCWSTFLSDRTALQSGHSDLKAADADLHTLIHDLK